MDLTAELVFSPKAQKVPRTRPAHTRSLQSPFRSSSCGSCCRCPGPGAASPAHEALIPWCGRRHRRLHRLRVWFLAARPSSSVVGSRRQSKNTRLLPGDVPVRCPSGPFPSPFGFHTPGLLWARLHNTGCVPEPSLAPARALSSLLPRCCAGAVVLPKRHTLGREEAQPTALGESQRKTVSFHPVLCARGRRSFYHWIKKGPPTCQLKTATTSSQFCGPGAQGQAVRFLRLKSTVSSAALPRGLTVPLEMHQQ